MAQDTDPFETGADVHFVDQNNPPWQEQLGDEPDPDDELLAHTPEDVIAILGFDPLELNDEPEDEDPTV